jgi:hypothetical protein
MSMTFSCERCGSNCTQMPIDAPELCDACARAQKGMDGGGLDDVQATLRSILTEALRETARTVYADFHRADGDCVDAAAFSDMIVGAVDVETFAKALAAADRAPRS